MNKDKQKRLEEFLVQHPRPRKLIIFALGVFAVWFLAGCQVKTEEAQRLQHMFDKCMEDKTITECRVSVEFKRSGD